MCSGGSVYSTRYARTLAWSHRTHYKIPQVTGRHRDSTSSSCSNPRRIHYNHLHCSIQGANYMFFFLFLDKLQQRELWVLLWRKIIYYTVECCNIRYIFTVKTYLIVLISTITCTLQSIIRCQAKEAVSQVLEFITECHVVSEFKEVSLKVFNSWITFELPVQESVALIGKTQVLSRDEAFFHHVFWWRDEL